MHPETKAIATFETDEDAKRAGYKIELTEREAEQLKKVPREERGDWLAQHKEKERRRLITNACQHAAAVKKVRQRRAASKVARSARRKNRAR